MTWITPSILNAIAQSAVERGFVQLISTLLLTLTLGLAAPAVGCAAAVAAIVQFIHHLHIVGQVDAVGKLFSERQGLRLSRVANFQSMENSIFRSNSVQTEPYVIKLRQWEVTCLAWRLGPALMYSLAAGKAVAKAMQRSIAYCFVDFSGRRARLVRHVELVGLLPA